MKCASLNAYGEECSEDDPSERVSVALNLHTTPISLKMLNRLKIIIWFNGLAKMMEKSDLGSGIKIPRQLGVVILPMIPRVR